MLKIVNNKLFFGKDLYPIDYSDVFLHAILKNNTFILNYDKLLKCNINDITYICFVKNEEIGFFEYYLKNSKVHNSDKYAFRDFTFNRSFKDIKLYYVDDKFYIKNDWSILPERIRELRNKKLKMI